jgi:hypothetical protein
MNISNKDSKDIQLSKVYDSINGVISELSELYDKSEMGGLEGGEFHQVVSNLYAAKSELNIARGNEPEFVDQDHFYNSELARKEGWWIVDDDDACYLIASTGLGEGREGAEYLVFSAAMAAINKNDLNNNSVRAMRFLKEYSRVGFPDAIEVATDRFSQLVAEC